MEAGEEYIYGRGAIDDKHSVIGILQALDIILKDGKQPKRFGEDETDELIDI